MSLTSGRMTLYIVLAALVYAYTALALAVSEPPETFRDAMGAALMCGAVAAMWPVAVTWRILVRPLPTA